MVVGGGITGLAAAHEARRQGLDAVVLEAATRAGGKIDSGFVDGAELPFPVDMAADGFLARQPEVVELCHELGLGDDLVAPTGAQAFIWADGALRSIPTPSVLGVPFEPDTVAATGLISEAGVADLAARVDIEHEPLAHDASVGEVMRPRVGDEVFERLVDPLLGGINAGNADGLSIEAGAPQLFAAACAGGSLRDGLRAQVTAGQAAAGGPVFNGVKGGNRRIIDTLVEQLGSRVRLGQTVVAIERDGAGWVVVTSDARFPADRVVLATPAWITAGLVAPFAPTAATTLADLVYGDAVLVTYVVDKAGIEHDLAGSGFLVPRSEGLLMTACSWASSKWGTTTTDAMRSCGSPPVAPTIVAGSTSTRHNCSTTSAASSRSPWACTPSPSRESRRGVSRSPSIGPATWPGATRSIPNSRSSPRAWSSPVPRCGVSGFRHACVRAAPPSLGTQRYRSCSAVQAASGRAPSPSPSIGRSRPSIVSFPPSSPKISAMC